MHLGFLIGFEEEIPILHLAILTTLQKHLQIFIMSINFAQVYFIPVIIITIHELLEFVSWQPSLI